MTDPATRLHELAESDEITVLPGAFDALSARLAERAGFPAVFTSGFSIAATHLGVPDLGLLTMAENVERAGRIAGAIDTPLVADMDTGYGNALNVRHSVEGAIDAGVAGVILEDQEWPKRCGHMNEKRVVPAETHARRIEAAADVRAERDSQFLLIARTDAREPRGLEAAIERGHRYREAGADVVFVEAPESRGELQRVADEFDAPTFANMIEGGKTPYLPADDLEEIGFDIVVYPLSALFAVSAALEGTYGTLYEEGTAAGVEGHGFEAFEAIIDAEQYRETERRYAED